MRRPPLSRAHHTTRMTMTTLTTTTARMEPMAMTMLTAMRILIPIHILLAPTAIITIITGTVGPTTIMTIHTIIFMITTIMIILMPPTLPARRSIMAAASPGCMSPA
jgi:hypothetical protein